MTLGVSDTSDDEARVDVGSELSQFTIAPLGEEETPIFAFFLIKTRGGDGDESWSFRTSSAPNLEELLGALQIQVDLLRSKLVAVWDAE